MKGYVTDIEKITLANTNFREVLYTAKNCQLVVMSLLPGEDIGAEVHTLDQFFRCEQGSGIAIIDAVEHDVVAGTVLVIPAGAKHNIVNGAHGSMKLYTMYAPPNHLDGTMHVTKADAKKSKEHFDGVTTE